MLTPTSRLGGLCEPYKEFALAWAGEQRIRIGGTGGLAGATRDFILQLLK
jgi:hypothetical protein